MDCGGDGFTVNEFHKIAILPRILKRQTYKVGFS